MLFSLSSCGESTVVATGDLFVREVKDVGTYNELEVRDIKIKRGTNYTGPKVNIVEEGNKAFSIKAQESLLQSIKVDYKGSRIVIYGDAYTRYSTDYDIEIKIQGMMFTTMDLSGAVSCKMDNVRCDGNAKYELSGASILQAGIVNSTDLYLNLSGASQFNATEVNSNYVKVDASGASQVNIAGTSKNIDIILSGASMFRGFEFVTDIVNTRMSGASQVNITLNGSISGSASGASVITYDGEGTSTVEVSGASVVKHRNVSSKA